MYSYHKICGVTCLALQLAVNFRLIGLGVPGDALPVPRPPAPCRLTAPQRRYTPLCFHPGIPLPSFFAACHAAPQRAPRLATVASPARGSLLCTTWTSHPGTASRGSKISNWGSSSYCRKGSISGRLTADIDQLFTQAGQRPRLRCFGRCHSLLWQTCSFVYSMIGN